MASFQDIFLFITFVCQSTKKNYELDYSISSKGFAL